MSMTDVFDINVGGRVFQTDWGTFFISLRKYLEYFRSYDRMPTMRGFPSMSNPQMILETELAGLLACTELATAVARNDPEARRQINEERTWNCVENVVGLLSCGIPLGLKGKLYDLLAAMAIDENIAVHVWNCLISEGICIEVDSGKFCGIQQDLEEQETTAKAYDCSQGFLGLMKQLFSHKTRPDTEQLAPYLHFIVKSIVCQFLSRSYVDIQQMWDLVKLALDSLYELLRSFYVTQISVSKRTSEVWLLTQLLNNTPLLINVLNIIVEGRNPMVQEAVSKSRGEASLAAIRLIYIAISHRSPLADAIRAIGSNLMICTVEALMFSPLPNFGKQHHSSANCLSLLFTYIKESDYFINHTFYVIRILRNLCCQRPSLQKQILQAVAASKAPLIEKAALLTSVVDDNVEVLHTDLLLTDVEGQPVKRIRGEIIRNVLEICIDSLRSDPNFFNLAYYLLGFDSSNIDNTDINFIDNKEVSATCLYNFMEIVDGMATNPNCFDFKYTGLFEPCLRLLLKLASFGSMSSSVTLRIMRSHYNMIYKLVTSDAFRRVENPLNLNADPDCAAIILRKSIQCIVLELVALEISALLRLGQSIELPKIILSALLSDRAPVPVNATNNSQLYDATLDTEPISHPLLWSLLEQSQIDVNELKVPVCTKFDSKKVDELIRLCVRKNAYDIEQYDIEYLHLLLNTEINAIMNAEIGVIKREARNILEYCSEQNAKNLLEGTCIHLLSGWLSVVNVLAIHSPLMFLDDDVNKKILIDALFLLKSYCFSVDTNVQITSMISSCIFRVVRAICGFYAQSDSHSARQALFPIVHLLLECISLPRYSKCIRFKMDLYGSILCIFDTCNRSIQDKDTSQFNIQIKNGSIKAEPDEKSLLKLSHLMDVERQEAECWSKYFESMTAEIVDTISSDITYAPLSLKIAATACLSDIIREDIVHSKSVAHHFVYSGAMACVLDSLTRVVLDFRNEKKNTKANADKCRKQLLLVKSLFSLFTRLAASEYGWTAMINGRFFERLVVDDEKENKLTNGKQTEDGTINLFKKLLETMSKF